MGERREGEEALSSIARTWRDRKVRGTPTKRRERGQGNEAEKWGIGKTEAGGDGSYVILFVKRINAHGKGGEEERWSEGIEAGDGGGENLFETFMPHDESILHQLRLS